MRAEIYHCPTKNKIDNFNKCLLKEEILNIDEVEGFRTAYPRHQDEESVNQASYLS